MNKTAFGATSLKSCLAMALLTAPVAAQAQPGVAESRAFAADPLVAFSLLGSSESRAAVCGQRGSAQTAGVATVMATASTTAAATTEQTAPGAGCVLPMIDPPPALVPNPGTGFGLAPFPVLLLAAGGIILSIITLIRNGGNDQIDLPISPA